MDFFRKTKIGKDFLKLCDLLWAYFPRFVKKPLVYIIMIVCAVFCYLYSSKLFYEYANAKLEYENNKKDNGCKITNKFSVSYFNDNKEECIKWKGIEELINNGNNIFQPNLTGNFSEGREIFFDHKVSSYFQALLIFIPLDENEISVAVNYGHLWRVVVGNGDYNQMRLQKNERFPEENLGESDWKNVSEKNGNKWIKPNRGLEPRKEIKVIIESRLKTNTSKVVVNVLVTGFLKGSDKAEDFERFSYEIETNQIDSLKEMVGIGLLDSHKKGIKTKLKKFELHEF